MTAIPGTVIGAQIVPSDSSDTYSTHEDVYGKGGFRSVVDLTERDLISTQRRKEGMLVFVSSEQKTYQLKGGILNSNWELFETGSSLSGEQYNIPFFIATNTISGSNDFIYDFNTGTLFVNGSVEVQTLSINGNSVTDILDEDDFSSNSSTALATQQSIKTYVDNKIDETFESTVNPNITGDSIDSVELSGGMVEWTLVVTDYTNYRSEKIMTVSNGLNVEFSSFHTSDIGDTSDVLFYVEHSGNIINLKSINYGPETWTVRFKRSIILI